MKLSKTSWIFLATAVFLFAAVTLGWTYSQNIEQQNQMTIRLNLARKTLSGINTDELLSKQTQLTKDIPQYQSQISEVKTNLSFSGDSLSVTDNILARAAEDKVSISTLSYPGLGVENVTGTKCQTLVVSIQVKGEKYSLSNFIAGLSQVFPTSVVKSVSITPGAKSDIFAANINLVIYSYKGN